MLTYSQLKKKPKKFLAATGLSVDEFEQLLPVFEAKLAALAPAPGQTQGRQAVIHYGVSEDLPIADHVGLAVWSQPAADELLDPFAAAAFAASAAGDGDGTRKRPSRGG